MNENPKDESQRELDIKNLTSVEYNKKYRYLLKRSDLRNDIKVINSLQQEKRE